MTLDKKKCREGLNLCMNYEFNLLHHVDVVAKRVRAAAAAETAHEGDDNTPSGQAGRRVKTTMAALSCEWVNDSSHLSNNILTDTHRCSHILSDTFRYSQMLSNHIINS